MNRSYQHSFLQQRNAAQQQTFNSTTEVESMVPNSGVRESIGGSTTDIIYPRGIDKVRLRNEELPPSHSAITHKKRTGQEHSTDRRNSTIDHHIVDDQSWIRMSKVGSKKRRRGAKPEKPLSAVLRKNAAALDSNGKLNLVGCYLTELDNLPDKLSNRVKTLFLSQNSLESLLGIQQFRNVTCVSLANNAVRYLDALQPLAALTSLEKLTLDGNVVTTMPYYREIVLGLCCPEGHGGLVSLDGIKVTPEEHRHCLTNYRRAAGQMEQMRCSGLRVAVLSHLEGLTRCHAEIVGHVLGRFRWVQVTEGPSLQGTPSCQRHYVVSVCVGLGWDCA